MRLGPLGGPAVRITGRVRARIPGIGGLRGPVGCQAAPVVTRPACQEVSLLGVSRLAAGLDEVLGCGPARAAPSATTVTPSSQSWSRLRVNCAIDGALARGQLTRAYSLLLSMRRDTAGRDKPD